MFFALVLVPLVALATVGGPAPAWQQLRDSAPQLLDPFSTTTGEALGVMAALSLLAWGLGYFGQPHIAPDTMARRRMTRAVTAPAPKALPIASSVVM